jgi:hypothetical protein
MGTVNQAVKICLTGLLFVATIAAAPAASGTGQGLYGTVKKGPTKPVCPAGDACDAPAQVILIFAPAIPSSPKLYTVRSKTSGVYRISLPSGYYTVTTKQRVGITRNIRPHRVHVRRGTWDTINFFIDTGIR